MNPRHRKHSNNVSERSYYTYIRVFSVRMHPDYRVETRVELQVELRLELRVGSISVNIYYVAQSKTMKVSYNVR